MKQQKAILTPKGMQKDTSVTVFSSEYAFDIKNMRFTATDENSFMCLTNEKSNIKVPIYKKDTSSSDTSLITQLSSLGTILGVQSLSDYCIVFRKVEDSDIISKLTYEDSKLYIQNLYEGNLKFNTSNPIESIGIYETENIHKVYWVDGINQARVINTSETGIKNIKDKNDTQFDFVPVTYPSNNLIKVDIQKLKNISGMFPAGVLQYAMSYYNSNLQETNLIYQSPLLYTSNDNRGLSSDTTSSNAFQLTIQNSNKDFKYIRVYRIIRTSLDSIPSVELVGEYKTDDYYIEKVEDKKSLYSGELNITKNRIISFTFDLKITGGNISNSFFDTSRLIYLKDPDLETSGDIVKDCSIIVEQPNNYMDKQDIIFEYNEGNKIYKYIIPKTKNAWLQWDNKHDVGNLEMGYSVYVAVKDEDGNWKKSTTDYIEGESKSTTDIVITDSGTTGTTVDPTSLLYKGGEPIYPYTIAHKDNTLFLGNVILGNPTISSEKKKHIKENSFVRFDYLDNNISDNNSDLDIQYLYNNNLDKKSNNITFFQKGETYRIGVQFLTKQGNWSEVIYLGDFKNDKRVIANTYNDDIKRKPIIKASIPIEEINKDGNFIAARLVCVYPEFYEREVLCQGLVLSTMYNVPDRIDNSPYAQASWFARPDCFDSTEYTNLVSDLYNNRQHRLGYPIEYRMSDRGGIIGLPDPSKYNAEIQYGKSLVDQPFEIKIDSILANRISRASNYYANFGVDKTIVTFHSPELDLNYDDKIYNISLDNVKFRVIGYAPLKTTLSDIEIDYSNPFNPHIGKFYYNDIKDPSSKIHVSGNSLVSFPFWVDSITNDKEDAPEKVTPIPTDSSRDYYPMASFPVYPWHRAGSLNNMGKRDTNRKSLLNNKTMSNLRICLATKYLSNEYSDLNISNIELFNSNELTLKKLKVWGKELHYYGNIDKPITVKNSTDQPIFIGSLVLSRTVEEPVDSYTGKYISPNNMVLTNEGINMSTYDDVTTKIEENKYSTDALPIQYKSPPHAVFAFEKNKDNKYTLLPAFKLKPDINAKEEDNSNVIFECSFPKDSTGVIKKLNTRSSLSFINEEKGKADLTFTSSSDCVIEEITIFVESQLGIFTYCILNGTDFINRNSKFKQYVGYYNTYTLDTPNNSITLSLGSGDVSWITYINRLEIKVKKVESNEIKYFTLNFNNLPDKVHNNKAFYITKSGEYIFEKPYDESYTPLYKEDDIKNLIWENPKENFEGFYQPSILIEDGFINSLDSTPFYFTVGEFYRDSVSNKFGGTSESALQNNKWLPCGDTTSITGNNIELIGDQGDTYFQRYDLLKTIPYSENCINNIIDITSFCCETRINIDGRYDRNRGLQDNTYITPNNFNLFNKVYSQQNNFFIQQYLDSEKFNSKNFPNQVTWSKTKTLGEEIDTWTNISLASILDLDGDKGALQKLLKFNNNIYAIQDRGVSAINFNPRVQINTSDGVPIEISNNGKVDGKIYISEKYGTTNKWSVVETPSGFYFVDGTNQEILACNGKEFSSLTMTNKMYSWLKDKDTSSVWSPVNIKAIRALYDSKNKDIYFTNDYEALSFSELSSTFTSRYSYDNVGWLFNFNNDTYQVYSKHINNSIWKLHGGDDYGYFFDEDKQNPVEYSIEYIVNDNFTYDKMFDTVELLTNDIFTADRTGNIYPFNTLQTQNEYQESMAYSSSMKKKFRIWRWPIGRNNRGAFPSRDRIRNTWIKLKLAGNSHDKIQLYNTSVIYYV